MKKQKVECKRFVGNWGPIFEGRFPLLLKRSFFDLEGAVIECILEGSSLLS